MKITRLFFLAFVFLVGASVSPAWSEHTQITPGSQDPAPNMSTVPASPLNSKAALPSTVLDEEPANAETPSSDTAVATPKPVPVLTPLPLTPLAAQLGQTIQSLVGVPSSQPTAPAASVVPANGSQAVSASTDAEDAPVPVTNSFANDVFEMLTQAFHIIRADTASFTNNLSAISDLNDWLHRQASDPRRQALWSTIGTDLLIIVGVPLLGSIAVGLILLPLRFRLRRREPSTITGRVAVLLGLLALRITPAVIFVGAALLLLDQNETHRFPRFVVLEVIDAIAIGYTLRQILRGIFAPATDHLRLFSFTTPQAKYADRWFSSFSIFIVFGYFFVEIATAVRMPTDAVLLFQNIFGLILTIMAITVIVQTRVNVALIIRGNRTDRGNNFATALRLWLARHWHTLAIAYLIISLSITALGIDNGIALMLRGTILTFIILVVSRLAFLALDRWTLPTAGSSTLMHRQILSFLLRPFIWVIAVMAIAATWGFHIRSLIGSPSGQRVTGAFISVALTLFVLTVIYEMLNTSIERHLSRRDKDDKQPVASARARTLLPMVRNSIFILFSGIAILTLLAAVGVNIGPLLAGAGVVGVAIGFGSQSLVKDFLTGLFIVVENTVAVGDVVKIGDFGGVVEALSIRTIRLRDSDGSLHILPFSEVSKITNMTKGFAYALVDIGVAYGTDLDHAMQVLRNIGGNLQQDPIFKRVILEPIEVMGIEKLGDWSITIRCRIRTRPGKQWDVKRLLQATILKVFAEENIDIPFPTSMRLEPPSKTTSAAADAADVQALTSD